MRTIWFSYHVANEREARWVEELSANRGKDHHEIDRHELPNGGSWKGGGRMPVASRRSRIRMARSASMRSMVGRFCQRSTKTPAIGPAPRVGRAVATKMPLTASGAQRCSRAMEVAIQKTSV